MEQRNLAARLHMLRLRAGKTQNEVAGAIHCSRQTYSNYERGTRLPDVITLVALADYYQVTTDYLLRDSADPDVPSCINRKK